MKNNENQWKNMKTMKQRWIFMSPLHINEKTMKNIEKCMKFKERSTKINENPWHTSGHEQNPEQDFTRLREQGNLQEACGNSFN